MIHLMFWLAIGSGSTQSPSFGRAMPFLRASSGWVAAGRCAYLRSAVVAAMSHSRPYPVSPLETSDTWLRLANSRQPEKLGLALRVLVNAEGFTLSVRVVL